MKKYILLFILLPIFAVAQKLEPVDSLTADMILKKHFKVLFFTQTEDVRRYYCGDMGLTYPGDREIRNVIPGMGKWYLRPDYLIQRIHFDTPYLGFSNIYKLEIPDSTTRNDSIAGYNIYRVYSRYKEEGEVKGNTVYMVTKRRVDSWYLYYRKNITACLWLGQNTKDSSNLEYLNDSFNSGIFIKRSIRYGNKKYECEPERSQEKYPLLAPHGDKEIKNFLHSELMKNIYAYRIIKSGLIDSVRSKNSGMYIREDINLYSFVDRLLPDMDCELAMKAEKYKNMSGVEIWRFFYPGADYIIRPNGEVIKDTTWSQYIQLKPQYYVVAYDTVRELVHFLSGDDFFKTKDYYKDVNDHAYRLDEKNRTNNDSLQTAYCRESYIEEKLLAYRRFYELARDEDKLKYDREDEEYWYYIMTNCPVFIELVENIFNRSDKPFNRHIFKDEICDYRIRMSKKDYNIVEIYRKENCKIRELNEKNFAEPGSKNYIWKNDDEL
ncbi:MAG: hypothetical protein LBG92_05935 [Prevotellaceae bacterium]|jgi:hypothetical protein|nr:hypothetical protein [Prevotellaceae bacterium]